LRLPNKVETGFLGLHKKEIFYCVDSTGFASEVKDELATLTACN